MSSSSVYTSPPRYHCDKDEVYKPSPTYKGYVRTLCTRNPSLLTLHSFLANPKARNYGYHATTLDFRHGISTPVTRRIPDVDCLPYEFGGRNLSDLKEKDTRVDQYVQGRILIIEDLTVDVIQILGSELDLDPLFLATHLHTVHRTGMRHQTPDDATLPSHLHDSNYVNVSYHQPATSNIAFPSGSVPIFDQNLPVLM